MKKPINMLINIVQILDEINNTQDYQTKKELTDNFVELYMLIKRTNVSEIFFFINNEFQNRENDEVFLKYFLNDEKKLNKIRNNSNKLIEILDNIMLSYIIKSNNEIEYLTTEEAMNFLSTTNITLHSLIKEGTLPAFTFGKRYRLLKSDLIEFMESRRIGDKTTDKPKLKPIEPEGKQPVAQTEKKDEKKQKETEEPKQEPADKPNIEKEKTQAESKPKEKTVSEPVSSETNKQVKPEHKNEKKPAKTYELNRGFNKSHEEKKKEKVHLEVVNKKEEPEVIIPPNQEVVITQPTATLENDGVYIDNKEDDANIKQLAEENGKKTIIVDV